MSVTIVAGPRQVEPANIERALEELWISLPPSGGPASTPMSMRAVVANLIAVRDSDEETTTASEVIGNIIGHDPCRVILVTSEPDVDPPGLIAEVAVISQKSATCQRCVCCDQIRLAARGIMADNLPSMTAALFVPDLPVVVWWPKPPLTRKDFTLFAEQADRVIVDSAGYSRDDLRQLARFVEQSRQTGTTVSDLNWARLTAYRQIFAQFFDAQECRDHLAMIQSLNIEADVSTGLLLAGWLKAQLDKSGSVLPSDRISLVVTNPAKGCSFNSIVMNCSEGKHSFAVTCADACTLEARATHEAQVLTRIAKAKVPTVDKLLGEEITFLGRDTVFEAALAAAAAL